MMPYPVKAVANEFLRLAEAEGKKLTPMQIQKLVYFAHGWYLALTDEPLVKEQVEAWTYGPVFAALYHEFKEFGAGPITRQATEIEPTTDPKTGKRLLRIWAPSLDDESDVAKRDYVRSLIRRVWDVYGSLDAVQLSQLTHLPGSPWEQTRSANLDRVGTDITDGQIKAYFRSKVAQEA